jgi:hypothetical protein
MSLPLPALQRRDQQKYILLAHEGQGPEENFAAIREWIARAAADQMRSPGPPGQSEQLPRSAKASRGRRPGSQEHSVMPRPRRR